MVRTGKEVTAEAASEACSEETEGPHEERTVWAPDGAGSAKLFGYGGGGAVDAARANVPVCKEDKRRAPTSPSASPVELHAMANMFDSDPLDPSGAAPIRALHR